jgi:signal transduction histidine kinase
VPTLEVSQPGFGEPLLSTRRFRVVVCVLGLATAPLVALAGMRDGLDLDAGEVISVLISWSFVAGGFIAWERRPENRIGVLLVLLGLGWTAGRLMAPPTTSSSLIYTIGIVWRLAWFAGFVSVLLAFPTGRLSTAAEKIVVGVVFIAAVPLQILWLLFLEEEDPPNAFLVWPSKSTAAAIDALQRIIWIGAAIALIVLLAKRWMRASRPLRRTLTPLLAGAATIVAFSLFVIVDKLRPGSSFVRWGAIATFIAVPVALLASILRARLARTSVGDLFIELRANPAPEQLRDALAHALRDPSVTLGYWLPEYETYADLDGQPIELPDDGGRATTLVERDGAQLAALVHDAALREEPALLEAVCAAAELALENARLQSEVRARLEELRGSRARILEAAQTERQRLERDLHDGAQQRLVTLSMELGALGARLDANQETRQALDQVRRQVVESLQELRELARGIHPAVVTAHGLEVALKSLVARTSGPVRLSLALAGRMPEAVEVAAFYLVSETLTNVARHANASNVTVDLRQADGALVIEVVDDGVGGANTDGGSGLRGLADRVETLGGRLRVWSPTGGGTRIRAEIPCA